MQLCMNGDTLLPPFIPRTPAGKPLQKRLRQVADVTKVIRNVSYFHSTEALEKKQIPLD